MLCNKALWNNADGFVGCGGGFLCCLYNVVDTKNCTNEIEGAAQEARVVPEHACAHGCREHHNPDPLVVDLGRSRIRRGVVLLEEISHGDRGSNFCHDASGLGERQRSDAHSEVISCC